jgi:predicted 3-demethylubiquinone-9 3-methyltransferase (glyoxalase superfamily)
MAQRKAPARKPAKKITSARSSRGSSRTPAKGASSRTRQQPQRSGTQTKVQTISPCLWFDSEAEDAARFYTSIFKSSKINTINRYPPVGQEIHGREAGSVMTVDFVLNGVPFTALNGGPVFKFNEAVSFQVLCANQEEIDYYWEKLGEGGDPKARQCGWLKDKFGLSWQIAPDDMMDYFRNPDSQATQRAFNAMMQMKKLDIAALKKAFKG